MLAYDENYSSDEGRQRLIDILSSKGTMSVSDGDGSILTAVKVIDVTDPHHPFVTLHRVPKTIDPFAYAEDGRTFTIEGEDGRKFTLEKDLFTPQLMNVYLTPEMVDVINHFNASTAPTPFVINTGRSREQFEEICAQSGVEHPERTSAITDHGERIFVNGQQFEVRPWLPQERAFFNQAVSDLQQHLQASVDQFLLSKGQNPDEYQPVLIEPHKYSITVNARGTLEGKGLKDNEGFGLELLTHIRQEVARVAAREENPITDSGKKKFIQTNEPFSAELRTDVNKGIGIDALLRVLEEQGCKPERIVFIGDSFKLGGTDVEAALYTQDVQPFNGTKISDHSVTDNKLVQVLHPVDAHAKRLVAQKDRILPPDHPFVPDFVLATPWQTSALLAEGIGKQVTPDVAGARVAEVVSPRQSRSTIR